MVMSRNERVVGPKGSAVARAKQRAYATVSSPASLVRTTSYQ